MLSRNRRFQHEKGRKEYAVLIKGNVEGEENVPVRIESACVTGTALHSAGCDCSQQLDRAFDIVTEHGSGVIMYMLPEEGRGLGLAKKIRIYAQMAKRGDGDSHAAAADLGYTEDARDHQDAALILADLGVRSVQIITNNPDKPQKLTRAGINVSGIISAEVPATELTKPYLRSKQRRGHNFQQPL